MGIGVLKSSFLLIGAFVLANTSSVNAKVIAKCGESNGYASIIRELPHWINKTQHPKSVHMRELLRDYVLIMANTGMRHGTEAQNLKWQHITQFEDNGQSYLEMSVERQDRPQRHYLQVWHYQLSQAHP